MKKTEHTLITFVACLAIFIILMSSVEYILSKRDNAPFHYDFYSHYSELIALQDDNINVGPIKNMNDVIEKANELWDERNFEKMRNEFYVTQYDWKHKCWLVYKDIPGTDWIWDSPTAIIHDNGDVLAVWEG